MVLPSGETSSETHVPSSVVNSTVRSGFSGSPCPFFFGWSFWSLDSDAPLSFSCAARDGDGRRSWARVGSVTAESPTARARAMLAARRCDGGVMDDPFFGDGARLKDEVI